MVVELTCTNSYEGDCEVVECLFVDLSEKPGKVMGISVVPMTLHRFS